MTDPTTRPIVARGNHLVFYAPPAPAAAREVLRGALDRLAGEASSLLALAPLEAVGEWTRVAEGLRDESAGTVAGAGTPERLARILGDPTPRLVFTSPEAALDLVHRAGLKPAEHSGFLILWPEAWGSPGADHLTELFQDVPRETQRVIVSSDPAATAPLVERLAWRASVTDQLGPANPSQPEVLSAPVAWSSRVEAVKAAIEQLDPDSVSVWATTDLDVPVLERALRERGASGRVGLEPFPRAGLVIAYDLPNPATLETLSGAGPVLLLTPSGTERYVAWLAPARRPLHLRGALDRAREETDRIRGAILRKLDQGLQAGDLAVLAPLLERFEATAVSAALFRLWRERTAPPGAEPSSGSGEAPVRLWISVGKRDGATVSDLVAVLARECEVPREAIGRIELRESFALVEIGPPAAPEQVAERLTGKSIRKRRLVARLDRPSASLVQRVAKRLPGPKDRRRT